MHYKGLGVDGISIEWKAAYGNEVVCLHGDR
jgi:hypothetical protein